jgi:hypothetical protein
MKNIITIVSMMVASFLSEMLSAQYIPLVKESKYWIYYDFQARPRPTTGFLITIKGDTSLHGQLYKKVFKYELKGELKNIAINEPMQFVADHPYSFKEKKLISLVREDVDNKLIYNLPIKQDSCDIPSSGIENPCNDIIFCDSAEHVLFDFSLQNGDTLNYCCFAPLHYEWEIKPEKVDSIKMEMHFGKLRKTYYTVGVPGYLQNLMSPGQIPVSKVKIIEGIGFQHQGIFNYRFGNLVDYCEGDFNTCNIVNSTNEIGMNENQVDVFPNPTSGYLRFEANSRINEISLFNFNFEELMRAIDQTQLDIDSIPDGVYICRIKLIDGNILHRKVIKLNN